MIQLQDFLPVLGIGWSCIVDRPAAGLACTVILEWETVLSNSSSNASTKGKYLSHEYV